ncbi:hypothetical protein E1B28_012037 [Marasmius oreades]|uniref:Uncharacterized protein n=1 Tax=Marasmius oreades TaxID=181124 RepID=A0A9P7RRD3_9AGAR|nr:uncharacterized protein E1B28_012037 [Marasmius oreades]KAG7087998.1 hypothetical protein E1B28_012037 [Marasmius oreades]
MFNDSYSNKVGSATLNNIQGNQHINYYLQHQHQSVPAHAGGEEWKRKMYREYTYVPAGNIKIIKTIAVQSVWQREYENDPDCLESHHRYDTSRANRVAHLACISVEGREESSPFLCVAYTGSDAQKVFKRDCVAFSRIRSAHVMQLRGFNDSDIPMVLFHEELIPVHHIFQRHRESSLALRCYIALQASIARKSILEWHQTEDDYYCSNVWIQPRNGRISFGPAVPLTEYFSVYGGWELGSCTDMPAVPIDMYNANCLLKHLLNYSSDNFLLSCLDLTGICRLLYREEVYVPQNNQVWLCSSGRPIANFQPRSCWTHRVWQSAFVEDHCQPITLEDGRTRLPMKSIALQLVHQDFISFIYKMDQALPHRRRHTTWLSQSCCIFSTMNTPRHEWSDCTLLDSIWLKLIVDPNTFDHTSDTNFDCIMVPSDPGTRYYLFVLPPPQRIDNSPDVITWILGKDLYYWSSDPDGKMVMPENQRVSLGLPSFIPDASGSYRSWSAETYDLMRAWQEAKGFDPSTTDFARSSGHPIMEPAFSNPMDGDVERFRALSEDTDVLLYTTLKARNSDERAMDVDLPTSLSNLRIEVGDQGASVVEGFVTASTDMEVD